VYSSDFFLSSEADIKVVVTGPGSVWNNTGSLDAEGYGFDLTITNGGAVYSGGVTMQDIYGSFALVTGMGSILRIAGSLTVAPPGSLTVADDGAVVADNVNAGGSSLNVAGGGLYVTNGPGTIELSSGPESSGNLALNGGTVTANQLIVDGSGSSFGFASGLLVTGGTSVTNGQDFVVGDGTDGAVFELLGGLHSFANGLLIDTNSFVTGCGTIDGSVVIDPDATVLANCGGTLTFTGIVTNNGTLRAINGSILEFYGPVVNNGLIDITGGTTNFHNTFVNNGTIISAAAPFRITSLAKQTNNILITWLTTPGQTNELQATSGGPGGTYSTNNFTPIFAVTNTVGNVTNYLDVGGATNAPARYYRVRLVQ